MHPKREMYCICHWQRTHQSYQDEVKESSKGKSIAASSAPKKQRTTGVPASIPKEGQPGETLCGIQAHLSDKSLAEFPNRDWPAIEYWAEKELLKPGVKRTAHQPVPCS